MSKETTCKYNLNRDSSDIALPFCVWKPEEHIKMPPHYYFARKEISPDICVKCKAYEKFLKNEKDQGQI